MRDMRKISKIPIIALIFTLTGTVICYAENLRVPMLTNKRAITLLRDVSTTEELNRRIMIINRVKETKTFDATQDALVYVNQKINEKKTEKPVIFLLDSKGVRGKTTIRQAIMNPGPRQEKQSGYSTSMFNPKEIFPIKDFIFHGTFHNIKNQDTIFFKEPLYLDLLINDQKIILENNMFYDEYIGYYFNNHLKCILEEYKEKKVILWDEAGSEECFTTAMAMQPSLGTPVSVICLIIKTSKGKRIAEVTSWEWGNNSTIFAQLGRKKKPVSEKKKPINIYSLYPNEEERCNELWASLFSDDLKTAKQIKEKIKANSKKLGYDACLILIDETIGLMEEIHYSSSKLGTLMAQYDIDKADSNVLKKSIFYAIENIIQHGGTKGALLVFFKVLDEEIAEFTFVLLDDGDGFINRENFQVISIDEAVKLGKHGTRDHCLTNIEAMSHGLAITEIHESKGKKEGSYWVKDRAGNIKKSKLSQIKLEELSVQHGTKIIFVRQVKGHFTPKTIRSLDFPLESTQTSL